MPDAEPPRRPGWTTVAAVAALYIVAVAAATYPHALRFATHLPAHGDPPQHLWIMRWYKSCLLEGRSPFLCRELQYPVGAPLGGFSPLHIQSLIFVPLSLVIRNDILTYNIIWLIGMVTPGLGTFALAWSVVRDRACAALGGLLAMLSAPVLLHAHAHLELIYVGAFPVFLAAWVRFVDWPTGRRLAAAVGSYLLVSACAAYFAVLAAVPAASYVVWELARAGSRRKVGAWLRGRLGWLAAFAALVLPPLAGLFAGPLLAAASGQSLARSRAEFADHGAMLWGYAAPTALHALGSLLPFDPYDAAGYKGIRGGLIVENASYLGVVALVLLHYAAVNRVGFRRSGSWWAALGLLVVLSLGARARLGRHTIGLPGLWLWRACPPFRLIRSPARFNLLAALVAAVIAAAGARHLLDRCRRRGPRALIWAALVVLAVADLANVPFTAHRPAPLPACYAEVARRDPGAAVLELPLQSSSFDVSGLDRTYWQSLHRLRTSAGYSGINNAEYDSLVCRNGAFPTWRAGFLADPERETFGPVAPARFRDVAWLYLAAHDFRFVVVHRPASNPVYGDPGLVGRLEAQLVGAKVFEDAEATVYDRRLLPGPSAPALICTTGWRPRVDQPGPDWTGVSRRGGLAAYTPDPSRPLILIIEAAALHAPRVVRLRHDGRDLARWRIEPGAPRPYRSPPFRLPAGVQTLTLESDREQRPDHAREAIDGARTPYSLRVDRVALRPAESRFSAARGPGDPAGRGAWRRRRRRPGRRGGGRRI